MQSILRNRLAIPLSFVSLALVVSTMFDKPASKPLSQELLDPLAAAQKKMSSQSSQHAHLFMPKRAADSYYRLKRAKMIRRDHTAGESASPTPTPHRENPADPAKETLATGNSNGVNPTNVGMLPPHDGKALPTEEVAPPVIPARNLPAPAPPFGTTGLISPPPKTPITENLPNLAPGSRLSAEKAVDPPLPAEIPLSGQASPRPGFWKSRQSVFKNPLQGRPKTSRSHPGESSIPASGYREAPTADLDDDEQEFSPSPSPSELADFLGDPGDAETMKERMVEVLGKLIWTQREVASQTNEHRAATERRLSALERNYLHLIREMERQGDGCEETSPERHIARVMDHIRLAEQELTALSAYYYPRAPSRSGRRGCGRWQWIKY
ncbi:hypothetical protein KSP39_PZI011019 [Platanthera zijinensis]|uniref:Uncharacterized protein n=1 Tax=Platanthera zijinensis TaxID=2320716 RepID=A0AAP0BGH2_9ASPA